MSSDWPRVRLHVVTGKGGTGKTTVAASLALALASHGKNVLVCEVEGRQGLARMFDVDPLPYAETRIATGLRGEDGRPPGTVHALHIDAESALLEYLAMYYRLGRAGKALDRFGVVEFATTIAPGVRDVLLTGTPAGVGVPHQTFLSVGDQVDADIEGIGRLSVAIEPSR